MISLLAPRQLAFDERAVFVAGPARSGTTLLMALLDSHPELLVLPEETAYFPGVLARHGRDTRKRQFEYLTAHTLANVLFGGACKWGRRDYSYFPTAQLLEDFRRRAFLPANSDRDLLVLLMESYAAVCQRPQDSIKRWVEKTPANRDYLDAIFHRFPQARILFTLRDPRALLASHILLERTRRLRRFSAYFVIRHWRTAAHFALKQKEQQVPQPARIEVVKFGDLVFNPTATLRRVCDFLDITFQPSLLQPTKAGHGWGGNSATERPFPAISPEPENRWRTVLSSSEIGWIEWHCRDLMESLGYEPLFSRRQLRHWYNPVSGETPREYLRSRFYSVFGKPARKPNLLSGTAK